MAEINVWTPGGPARLATRYNTKGRLQGIDITTPARVRLTVSVGGVVTFDQTFEAGSHSPNPGNINQHDNWQVQFGAVP